MKRDMDLARQILLEVEKYPHNYGMGIELDIPDHSAEEIEYNVILLRDAGLVLLNDSSRAGPEPYMPTRLTWEGHEFLDAARDDGRWEKAKGAMAQVGGFVFEVAQQLLVSYMKAQLGLP
jgi:uncharacterized protein DUF2513